MSSKFLDKTGLDTLWAKIKSTFQTLGNLVTAWGSTPSDTKYPSEKLVKTSLDEKVDFQYNDSSIGNDSPAAECKAFFGDDTKNPARRVKLVYNDKGSGNTIIFSRAERKKYGNILKYGYNDRYLYLLRFKNNVWLSEDWEKIYAGYADTAGTANAVAAGAIKERNVEWGGSFRTTKSPIETFTKQNSFFYPKPSAVGVEYSNNRTAGTPTWVDYGLTDYEKRALFSGNEGAMGVYCGKKQHVHPGYTGSAPYKDLSNENIADQGLRITIACRSLSNRTADTDNWIYCYLRGILLYMSTQSAGAGAHCVVEKQNGVQYKADQDEWVTLGDYKIQGDSGWNSIPYDGAFGGGWYQTSSYSWVIRFTIWSDRLSATPNSGQTGCLQISSIAGINHIVWSATNPVQRTGLPFSYSYDGTMTLMQALPLGSGGTGATTAIGAEYNILNQVADIDTTIDGNRKIALCNQTKSASNGVFRWLKLSNVWTWIKGLLSSESGVNISGNAATATTAAGYTSGGAIDTALHGKVDKETGKGLSTNDYTTADKNKVASAVQPGDLGTAAYKDVPASGDASTTQVVMGDDSRLSDARPASDVSSWAKATTKPTYTASEVGAVPTSRTVNGKALSSNISLSASDVGAASVLSIEDNGTTAYGFKFATTKLNSSTGYPTVSLTAAISIRDWTSTATIGSPWSFEGFLELSHRRSGTGGTESYFGRLFSLTPYNATTNKGWCVFAVRNGTETIDWYIAPNADNQNKSFLYMTLSIFPLSEYTNSGATCDISLSLRTTALSTYLDYWSQVKIAYLGGGTSAVGSTTKPVYVGESGAVTACNNYGGGTAVTLNGSSKAANTASFYAPTTAGTSGKVLKSNGSGAPTWGDAVKYVTSIDTSTMESDVLYVM